MNKLLLWLNSRKPLTTKIAIIYFIAVVFLHEEVSKISLLVQKKLSINIYNHAVSAVCLVILVFTLFFIFKKVKVGDDRIEKIIYWFLTTALIIISYKTLLVVNAESIHFIQYAIIILPIFALTMRFGETVLWATLLGAIDEAYQYFILYPDWKYFDFNDVILNLLGAGAGIVCIYSLLNIDSVTKIFNNYSFRKWSRSPVVIITFSGLIMSFSLYLIGILQFYPDADGVSAPITLSRMEEPKHFWSKLGQNKSYHVLNPREGIILSFLLISLYSFLDFRVCSRKNK